MIRLSVNVLNSMIILFQRLDSYGPSPKEEIIWASIEGVDGDILLELGTICKWLGFQESEKVCLLEDGQLILSLILDNLKCEAFRKMLCDYIQSVFPSWAARIPYGRAETSIILSKDEHACLYEAGLLSVDSASDSSLYMPIRRALESIPVTIVLKSMTLFSLMKLHR